MAWPDDETLPVEVAFAFGADPAGDPGDWSWTDVSERRQDRPIQMRSGRSSGSGSASASTASMLLDNDDGALTPLHAMSPYWPDVTLGVPLRVRLRRAEDAFGRTVSSGWGTADSGQAWTGSGGGASDYSVSSGAGRHSHGTANVLRRTTLAVSLVDVEQVFDVSTPALITGAALVTGALARYQDSSNYYWLRAEFNAGGTSVRLKISKRVVGVDTQLADLNPVPALSYAANAPLRVRARVDGNTLAVKVWDAAGIEPAGWQLTATDPDLTDPGAVGVQTWLVGGNTNVLPLVVGVDNYSAGVDLFGGWADQWKPQYIPSTDGIVARMQVTASGVLRRLSQGTAPARSAMTRSILASGPVAYWPVEDGALAGQVGSAIAGHPAMTVTGVTEFTADLEIAGALYPIGSSAVADLSGGGRFFASMPADVTAATVAEQGVDVAARVQVSFTSADVVLAEWTTPGGTYVRWQLVLGNISGTRLLAYDSSGAATTVITAASVKTSFDHHDVSLWQSGGTIQAGLYWSTFDAAYAYTGSVAGTLAGVGTLRVNATGTTATVPMPAGHVAIRPSVPPGHQIGAVLDSYGAVVWDPRQAWQNEAADERFARLCDEEGVPVTVAPVTDSGLVTRMGTQPAASLVELLREVETTDLGVLYERLWGLGFLPRAVRYSPPVAMTVDLTTYEVDRGGDPLQPVYDDQDVRNEVAVERTDGSSAVYADTVHQGRHGRYQDGAEVNLADDSTLLDHAAFRAMIGTVDEMREEAATLDLAANPDLVEAWLSCGIGSRIVRTGVPAQHPPGDIDRIVEGWRQTIGPKQWLVQLVLSPTAPWQVAVEGTARASAEGSALATGITATALSLSLSSTTDAGLWTTDPTDFPMDLRIGGVNGVGGEQVTATGISGASSPQTVTLSARTVNGVSRAWDAGTSVDVWQPGVAAL